MKQKSVIKLCKCSSEGLRNIHQEFWTRWKVSVEINVSLVLITYINFIYFTAHRLNKTWLFKKLFQKLYHKSWWYQCKWWTFWSLYRSQFLIPMWVSISVTKSRARQYICTVYLLSYRTILGVCCTTLHQAALPRVQTSR